MKDLTLWVVFIEGIASFLSPCFLPLIPIYIGYLTGETTEEKKKWNVIFNSIFFVLGFTMVFIALGAAASSLGHFLLVYKRVINRILGILIIIMGLFYMEIINPRLLNTEKRFQYTFKKAGPLNSFILGAALGFGWTPCIGSILASILAIAASKASIIQGIYLLFIYSMGIAVPFIVTAALIQEISKKLKGILKYTRVIRVISGVILVITGILIYTGYLERLSGILSM